jgi:hypothetical protein
LQNIEQLFKFVAHAAAAAVVNLNCVKFYSLKLTCVNCLIDKQAAFEMIFAGKLEFLLKRL